MQNDFVLPGEYRVVKNRFSGFMNTELDFMLRRLKVETLAVCGTQYPNCIRATVFDAVSLGYETIVITDATSAKTPQIAKANILDTASFWRFRTERETCPSRKPRPRWCG